MLCRAKQARKRGGYAAAVLAPAALGVSVYMHRRMCVQHAERILGTYVWTDGGGEKMGEAKVAGMMRNIYHDWRATPPLPPRVSLIGPARPWRKAWQPGRSHQPGKSRARDILRRRRDIAHKTLADDTKSINRLRANGRHAAATCYKRSSRSLPSKRLAWPRELPAVFAPSPALARLIFEFSRNQPVNRRCQTDRIAAPGNLRRRRSGMGRLIGEYEIEEIRGGHAKLSEKAGCKGWRAGVANPIHFFNAPKQGRTASVSSVPPTTPSGASTIS